MKSEQMGGSRGEVTDMRGQARGEDVRVECCGQVAK